MKTQYGGWISLTFRLPQFWSYLNPGTPHGVWYCRNLSRLACCMVSSSSFLFLPRTLSSRHCSVTCTSTCARIRTCITEHLNFLTVLLMWTPSSPTPWLWAATAAGVRWTHLTAPSRACSPTSAWITYLPTTSQHKTAHSTIFRTECRNVLTWSINSRK